MQCGERVFKGGCMPGIEGASYTALWALLSEPNRHEHAIPGMSPVLFSHIMPTMLGSSAGAVLHDCAMPASSHRVRRLCGFLLQGKRVVRQLNMA